jgi:Uma2 family endonuclease
MGLPQQKSDQSPRYTYADYCSWQGEERYQLIEGEAVLMAPAPAVRHQTIVIGIASQVYLALKDSPCQVFVAPLDVRLPKAGETDDQIDTVVQPDVLVVCDRKKLDDRGVRGAPEWVVEVLSPFTAGLDHVKKRRLYEQAGVREYWLVDPLGKVLTVYTLKDGAYGRPHTQELIGETPVGVLDGVIIQWDELAARLPQPEF